MANEKTIIERRRTNRQLAAAVSRACRRAHLALRAAARRIEQANRIIGGTP